MREGQLKKILVAWKAHYNRGRPNSSLGPGIPEPELGDPPPKLAGTNFRAMTKW